MPHLLIFQAHLSQKGRLSSSLKDEISLLQSVSASENVAWIKDLTIDILQGELEWETETENAIEKCGINVKLTNDRK